VCVCGAGNEGDSKRKNKELFEMRKGWGREGKV
jgi:hypothetical protein